MRKNLRQSIRRSLGRYIAIALIIALGAGIFVGLRMTKADMVATGQKYMDEQNMFDLRLMTDYGWGKEQVEDIAALEGVEAAEGVFYVDLVARQGDAEEDSVYRFYTMPRNINQVVLLGGRMPEAPNECLADGYHVDDSILGTQVVVSRGNLPESLDILREDTYTIVGYISTPLYMDMNRGTTSVGNGSILNYFMVPEEAIDSDYYTEIHLTLPGQYAIYSDAYNDAMEDMADQLEVLLEPIADARLAQVVREAEDAYSEGYNEYLDGLLEFYNGYHDAYDQLHQAYWQLMDGEQELADNIQLLKDAQAQLDEARLMLKAGEKTLEESKQTLASSKAAAYKEISNSSQAMMKEFQALTEELQTVDDQILQISTESVALGSKILPLETKLTATEAKLSQTKSMIGILDISIQSSQRALELAEQNGTDPLVLEQMRQELHNLQQKQDGYRSDQTQLEAEIADCQAQLEPLYAKQQELENQQAALESLSGKLSSSISTITEKMLGLVVTQSVMNNEFAAADAQIEAAESQISAGYLELDIQAQKLAEGMKQLEEGRKKLDDAWKEYEKGRKEAEKELNNARNKLREAKAELADARETIDGMTDITVHILNRNTNVGYASLDSSSDIVAGVSRVIPAFFLLVSALVCITTMTRMVDEERTQIGTLKALGYSNGAIISKYMLYAGSSAILGCGLGVLAGSVIFPTILWEAYKIMLFITDRIVLTFNIGLCLLVVGMFTSVELLVTWYCCRKALEEVPAELIRPKAPDAGKQLMFEKLPFWHKISFLNKVTIRNIFRYRQRLAMMMVGIGGCTALLLTGFGLRDTIVNIVDYQFEEVTTYDMSVYFREGQNARQQREFKAAVADYVSDVTFYHQTSVDLMYDNQVRELYMISGDSSVTRFLNLHKGTEEVFLPGKDEVVLSVGIAEALGIQIGDQVLIRDSDLRTLDLKVSGIYDNFVNNYCIVSPDTIEKQWGAKPDLQMAFADVKNGWNVYQVSARIFEEENVMNVSVSDDMASMVSNMMDALDLVVWVVVFCAGLLAAVVLYNLTNININERIREIATIKVLGFNAMETALYVFKENLSLSVMGAAVGLLLGKLLLSFVVSQIKIDFVWFQARAMTESYLWSVALTLLAAVIVDFVFYFKLEKINMAEALKSVE